MSSAGAGPYFDAVSSYVLRLGRLRAGKGAEDADEREHFAPHRGICRGSQRCQEIEYPIWSLQAADRHFGSMSRPAAFTVALLNAVASSRGKGEGAEALSRG